MKWYYTLAGSHVHVRVFMNGAKCGDLCFRLTEFADITGRIIGALDGRERGFTFARNSITFINETKE